MSGPSAPVAASNRQNAYRVPVRKAFPQEPHKGLSRFYSNAIKLVLCRIQVRDEEKSVEICVIAPGIDI